MVIVIQINGGGPNSTCVNHMRTFEHEKRLTVERIKSMGYKAVESKVEYRFWDPECGTDLGPERGAECGTE